MTHLHRVRPALTSADGRYRAERVPGDGWFAQKREKVIAGRRNVRPACTARSRTQRRASPKASGAWSLLRGEEKWGAWVGNGAGAMGLILAVGFSPGKLPLRGNPRMNPACAPGFSGRSAPRSRQSHRTTPRQCHFDAGDETNGSGLPAVLRYFFQRAAWRPDDWRFRWPEIRRMP